MNKVNGKIVIYISGIGKVARWRAVDMRVTFDNEFMMKRGTI